ncbi:hypothetical protein CIB48_g6993 [Xylaria polymorpha]|nr:hypothetical protein CIB48_g6993 [Xylaria polymorpha]
MPTSYEYFTEVGNQLGILAIGPGATADHKSRYAEIGEGIGVEKWDGAGFLASTQLPEFRECPPLPVPATKHEKWIFDEHQLQPYIDKNIIVPVTWGLQSTNLGDSHAVVSGLSLPCPPLREDSSRLVISFRPYFSYLPCVPSMELMQTYLGRLAFIEVKYYGNSTMVSIKHTNALVPSHLGQVFWYCWHAKTRFGIVISDREIVFIEFKIDSDRLEDVSLSISEMSDVSQLMSDGDDQDTNPQTPPSKGASGKRPGTSTSSNDSPSLAHRQKKSCTTNSDPIVQGSSPAQPAIRRRMPAGSGFATGPYSSPDQLGRTPSPAVNRSDHQNLDTASQYSQCSSTFSELSVAAKIMSCSVQELNQWPRYMFLFLQMVGNKDKSDSIGFGTSTAK